MKKIIFALAVLAVTVPAYATVTISCAQIPDTNCVAVSFVNDDAEMNVRALALDIQLDTADACVCDVNCVADGYTIYPGSISIDDEGVVTDWGTCVCDDSYPQTLGGLDTNGVTIEMGSLYVGEANAPLQSGELVIICVCGCGPVNISITENAIRGGVVMEDPEAEPDVVITGCSVDTLPACYTPCYEGMADYDQWVIVGEPNCWCYPRQCLGDADGLPYGAKTNYWVSIPDLTILKAAWNKTAAQLVGDEACADFDHLYYGEKTRYRVSIPDLTILKANWNILNGPDPNCLPGNMAP